MELLPLIAALIIFFSIMLTPCVSMHIPHQSASHAQDSSRVEEIKSSHPTLPRKLRVLIPDDQKAPSVNNKDVASQVFGGDRKQEADLSGKLGNEKREEWMEASQFMSMDYRPVTRRRPIHNKSLPLAP